MRRISVSVLRSASMPVLRDLLSGGEKPIIIESGRGKSKKPVAVLMSYDQFLAISVKATPELVLLREGLPKCDS